MAGLGLAFTFVRLLARFPGFFDIYLSNYEIDQTKAAIWINTTLPGDVPQFAGLVDRLEPHFPYGYDVLPD